MNQTLNIGFSDYADKFALDDESEYFPIVKVLITSIANTDKDNRGKIKAELIAFAKKRYITASRWSRGVLPYAPVLQALSARTSTQRGY